MNLTQYFNAYSHGKDHLPFLYPHDPYEVLTELVDWVNQKVVYECLYEHSITYENLVARVLEMKTPAQVLETRSANEHEIAFTQYCILHSYFTNPSIMAYLEAHDITLELGIVYMEFSMDVGFPSPLQCRIKIDGKEYGMWSTGISRIDRSIPHHSSSITKQLYLDDLFSESTKTNFRDTNLIPLYMAYDSVFEKMKEESFERSPTFLTRLINFLRD